MRGKRRCLPGAAPPPAPGQLGKGSKAPIEFPSATGGMWKPCPFPLLRLQAGHVLSETPAHAPPPLSPRSSGSEKRQRRGYSIRLLPDEHAAIEQKARAAGMSFASFIRACTLGDAGPRARRSPTVNAELFGQAVSALNKAASNLNQIAARLNAARLGRPRDRRRFLSKPGCVRLILDILGRADRP